MFQKQLRFLRILRLFPADVAIPMKTDYNTGTYTLEGFLL